jgi:hypothetical protein
MGTIMNLDALKRGKIPCTNQKVRNESSVPLPSHYIERNILSPCNWRNKRVQTNHYTGRIKSQQAALYITALIAWTDEATFPQQCTWGLLQFSEKWLVAGLVVPDVLKGRCAFIFKGKGGTRKIKALSLQMKVLVHSETSGITNSSQKRRRPESSNVYLSN